MIAINFPIFVFASAGSARQKKVRSVELNAANPALRDTGTRVMAGMPWGAHICVFYETKEDLIETAAGYFKGGLRSNEFCVWAISDPITETDAKDALHRAVLDFDRYLPAGAIELLQGTEWYLKGDEFDLQRITGGRTEKLRGALAKGYDGIRVSGNAFWIATKHWKSESATARSTSCRNRSQVASC